MSGRVDTIQNNNYDVYKLFEEQNRAYRDFNQEAIKNIHTNNNLSSIFFSETNVNALQDAIRYQVYLKSCKKHIISRQSDVELRVVMKSVYLTEARHGQYNILEEIKRINGIVLNYCVNKILQEINIYITYKNDITRLPTPIPRGEFSSAKGTRTLEINKL